MVTDVLGRILISLPISESKGQVMLDLSGYATGHYLVFLNQGENIVAQTKLILNQECYEIQCFYNAFFLFYFFYFCSIVAMGETRR
jgi:hypothetical protein